jgi:hypothetical protein
VIPRHVQIAIVLLLMGITVSGVYALRLRRREIRRLNAAGDSRPVPAPVSAPKERVTLLVAYDDEGVLRERQVETALPQEANARARALLRALLAEYLQKPSPHAMADGADVKNVYMLADGTCIVDVNQDFADGHRSGMVVEDLTLASMMETLTRAIPQVQRVRVLVEGKERETLAGHADLMQTYDASLIHQLAQEMM